jgi:hypothetical protein
MKMRILNQAGLAEASTVLDRLRSAELENVPAAFLESDEFSAATELDIFRPRASEIQNRWFFGIWLWQRLNSVHNNPEIVANTGLWTWLAFFLFDTIAPARARGRTIWEDARYILARGDYRKYYRHLVAGPYFMIRTHSDAPHITRGLLATLPDSPGDVYEQLAARPQIVTSPAAVAVGTKLYYDSQSQRLRRGAAGAGPGSARRYANVLMQYDVTFDLYTVAQDKLLSMLPREFERFLHADETTENSALSTAGIDATVT